MFEIEGKKYHEYEIFEHDPFIELFPEHRKALEAAGFKPCIDKRFLDSKNCPNCGEDRETECRCGWVEGQPLEEQQIDVWYHPDHWEVKNVREKDHPDRAGDTWLFDWSFFAKTPEAKRYCEES